MSKVWIVGLKDYGDNGWSVHAVFSSRKKAEEYVMQNAKVTDWGYLRIEENWDADDGGWDVSD